MAAFAAGYTVARRADGANDSQMLSVRDVSAKGSFTANEFSRLQFIARLAGSSDDLVVVAQSGTRLAGGTLFNADDGPAVQITANVTGSRSINAAGALLTDPTATSSPLPARPESLQTLERGGHAFQMLACPETLKRT